MTDPTLRSWQGISFAASPLDYDFTAFPDRVVHILCTAGSLSLTFQDVRYNLALGDYAILTHAPLVSDVTGSADLETLTMSLGEAFVASLALRSNYGIIGHLALLQNPVMKLSPDDFRICREDLELLRRRLAIARHCFREEMLGHLLTAHILNLYDIHARLNTLTDVPERTAGLVRQFVGMLYAGEYVLHRELPYYAARLCITPHYLSEICKAVSGRPATYWIDRFTLHEAVRLLRQQDLPLSAVAERLHFSSLSYFSRYVQRHIGVSPSLFRSRYATR